MTQEARSSNINNGDSGDESDSDFVNEQLTGNIHKIAIVPPNFTGRPKKGHLIFDACFECGNLGRVDYISDFEYDLFIRPDTCNARFRIWFNFTVENVKQEQRVIFNVVNFSKSKSLYREGMSPLVKSTSRPKWQRIPAKNVFYYRCPEHKKNYVMSFVFCFDIEDDVYQFAYAFPYSYTKLQNYLQILENRNLDYYERELLAMSVQQRRLDLLTICDPELKQPSDQTNKKRKIVTITARVHPGETPSSYVCQGLIEFLVSAHPVAKCLRENIIFKIIPMLNPDGVYLGNYRCSLMGFDLNRVWQDPSPWAHPELFAAKSQVLSFDKDPAFDLDFFIDIHAHSTMMNGFMYGNIYEDSNRYERQAIFPKLLCSNADDFSMNNTQFNRDAVKAGTGRRTLGGSLDENCYCYTLEVSFFSYQPVGFSHPIPYTEEEYMKLGRNLARTFLDYYKLQNLIVFNPTTSITPKMNHSQLVSIKNQSTSSNTMTSSNGNPTNTNNSTNSNSITNANNILNSTSGTSLNTLTFLNTNNNNMSTTTLITNESLADLPKTTSLNKRSTSNIQQTLKPLSSLSIGANSTSSLSMLSSAQLPELTNIITNANLNSNANASSSSSSAASVGGNAGTTTANSSTNNNSIHANLTTTTITPNKDSNNSQLSTTRPAKFFIENGLDL